MTEIDARKAARQEAERVSETTEDITKGEIEWGWGFEDGAQWAVDQLPSRDEIADAMIAGNPDYEVTQVTEDERDWYLRDADAVLALIRSRYEEEK